MQGYASHESFWADFKMYLSMVVRAVLVGVLAQLLVFGYGVSKINFAYAISEYQDLRQHTNQNRANEHSEIHSRIGPEALVTCVALHSRVTPFRHKFFRLFRRSIGKT